LGGILLAACTSSSDTQSDPADEQSQQVFIPNDNFPAEGFDLEGSSSIAIIIADKVMNAMGGRKNWDATRYITWNFFGSRKLLWDKQTGNVRIESLKDDLKILVNVNEMTGKVWKNGSEQTDPDSLAYYLERGRNMWINDSYWLVMPFKLKDSGVTLTYIGESQTLLGEVSEELRLTFTNVGVTPQNAYHVWVSTETSLVKQWAYYSVHTDSVPAFILPWDNYQTYGQILLSDDRGERDLTDIAVLSEVPERIFQSFDISL